MYPKLEQFRAIKNRLDPAGSIVFIPGAEAWDCSEMIGRKPTAATGTKFSVHSVPPKPQHREHGASP